MAYAGVLMLVLLLSVMGSAFLFSAHTQTVAATGGWDALQAEYLAESAANHAMWRMLNQEEDTTTATLPTVHGGDDASQENKGDPTALNEPMVKLGRYQYCAVRFQNVDIPRDAAVAHADVSFTAGQSHSVLTHLEIAGEASVDAPVFTEAADNIADRAETASIVTWNDVPAWITDNTYQTPDLASIIQEIVTRPGWARGNSLALIFRSTDAYGDRTAMTYNGDPAAAPVLNVQWSSNGLPRTAYRMHAFGGGNYGYKVRRHTATTFGTVATVGAVGDSVVQQSYVLYVKPEEKVAVVTNDLLFVVSSPGSMSSQEKGRMDRFIDWGYKVTLIDDNDSQANFDSAMAATDVIYVSGTAYGAALLDKVTGTSVGVVNELAGKIDNFGFSSRTDGTILSSGFTKTDPLHYITAPLSGSEIKFILISGYSMQVPSGTLAPDLHHVGEVSGIPALATLEIGATRADGQPAPARRAHLPLATADVAELTADGQQIMQRAIEWAAMSETGPVDPPDPPEPGEIFVTDISMGSRRSKQNYYGQATVWIKNTSGADVAGATVTGAWSDLAAALSSGVTGIDGRVMFESATAKKSGIFTFTVSNVSLPDATYNPTLNIETTDSITVP